MISPSEILPPAAPPLDLDLIRKYAVPGPRYTSYPPATRFTASFDAAAAGAAIDADQLRAAGPLSLYLHLPFCETRCWFCGCHTVITRRRDDAAAYLDLLEQELRLTAARVDPGRPVSQVHLGGGTPTFLPPDQLHRLGAMLHRHFPRFLPDVEFSVEVDPRRLTADHVEALRAIGVNRASLGVQDTDPRVQLAIHRHQPQALNEQTASWLRTAGFGSINVDLVYGLPLQTADSFARTIDHVLELAPDRLSVFGYAHVPWIRPAQRILENRGPLPHPSERLAMFAVAHAKLTAAGYVDIGLDHFARPDDELAVAQREGTLHRNFQGYSTRGGASLYAFGMSSISSTADTYRQNARTLPAWQEALAAGRLPVERGLRLEPEDLRRREIVMRVMCHRALDFTALDQAFGLDFRTRYAPEIASLEDLAGDGLVTVTPHGLAVTPAGVPLLRVVAMRFDPHAAPAANQHSPAI